MIKDAFLRLCYRDLSILSVFIWRETTYGTLLGEWVTRGLYFLWKERAWIAPLSAQTSEKPHPPLSTTDPPLLSPFFSLPILLLTQPPHRGKEPKRRTEMKNNPRRRKRTPPFKTGPFYFNHLHSYSLQTTAFIADQQQQTICAQGNDTALLYVCERVLLLQEEVSTEWAKRLHRAITNSQ